MDSIGLYQLNSRVKQALKERFAIPLWVVAEIADVKENSSGHCYMELVEKREADESVIASARATIWSFTYRTLKPYFQTTTGKALQKGMKVLLAVEVVFHELYGYSLNVKDIDPTFTVGDLERKKREILERLTREGVIDMNRELSFPLLPKVIAVISSPTAAGYGDFMDQLHHNPLGYVFHTALFAAVMQGERTTESVVAALERIHACDGLFDVVVIIRGGGSQTDLGSFDSYEMAANVAQFPIPVIAGIGHERDETIIDRVAYRSVKTPTAAAAFLVEAFQRCDAFLEEKREVCAREAVRLLQEEKSRQARHLATFKQSTRTGLDSQSNRLTLTSQRVNRLLGLFTQSRVNGLEQLRIKIKGQVALLMNRQIGVLDSRWKTLTQGARQQITHQRHRIEMSEATIRFADPRKVLERGFSITRVNGKAVRKVEEVHPGAVLETEFLEGTVVSEVKIVNH